VRTLLRLRVTLFVTSGEAEASSAEGDASLHPLERIHRSMLGLREQRHALASLAIEDYATTVKDDRFFLQHLQGLTATTVQSIAKVVERRSRLRALAANRDATEHELVIERLECLGQLLEAYGELEPQLSAAEGLSARRLAKCMRLFHEKVSRKSAFELDDDAVDLLQHTRPIDIVFIGAILRGTRGMFPEGVDAPGTPWSLLLAYGKLPQPKVSADKSLDTIGGFLRCAASLMQLGMSTQNRMEQELGESSSVPSKAFRGGTLKAFLGSMLLSKSYNEVSAAASSGKVSMLRLLLGRKLREQSALYDGMSKFGAEDEYRVHRLLLSRDIVLNATPLEAASATGDLASFRVVLSYFSSQHERRQSTGTLAIRDVMHEFLQESVVLSIKKCLEMATARGQKDREEIVQLLLQFAQALVWGSQASSAGAGQFIERLLRANPFLFVMLARMGFWRALEGLCAFCLMGTPSGTPDRAIGVRPMPQASAALIAEAIGLGVELDDLPSSYVSPPFGSSPKCQTEARTRMLLAACVGGEAFVARTVATRSDVPEFPLSLQGWPRGRKGRNARLSQLERDILQRCSALHLAALCAPVSTLQMLEKLYGELRRPEPFIDVIAQGHPVGKLKAESNATASGVPKMKRMSAVMQRLQKTRQAAEENKGGGAAAEKEKLAWQTTAFQLAVLGGRGDSVKFMLDLIDPGDELLVRRCLYIMTSFCCIVDNAKMLKEFWGVRQRTVAADRGRPSKDVLGTILPGLHQSLSPLDCAVLMRSPHCADVVAKESPKVEHWQLRLVFRSFPDDSAAALVHAFAKSREHADLYAFSFANAEDVGDALDILVQRGSVQSLSAALDLIYRNESKNNGEARYRFERVVLDKALSLSASFGQAACTRALAKRRHTEAVRKIANYLRVRLLVRNAIRAVQSPRAS